MAGAPAGNEVRGRGLFTERETLARFVPAAAGSGLSFRAGGVTIPASIANLSTDPIVPAFATLPPRHTNLTHGGVTVATVEHALSALAGLGIADAVVEVEALDDTGSPVYELPIDDGSASAFVAAIRAAGLIGSPAPAEAIVLRQTITVQDEAGGMVVAEPAAVPDFSYLLDYGSSSSPVPKQSSRWTIEGAGSFGVFADAVAPARTYSLRAEAEQMQQLGLFASFTPADLLVLDDDGSPIDNALRFENEPARHKLLDLIGDLALAGRPIMGRVSAYRSGHALNHEMARRLADL